MEIRKLYVLFLLALCSNVFPQAPSIQWQKSLGGTFLDVATSSQQTLDGGYIVVGHASSPDGDVIGHHGTACCADYWVLKLNSSGNVVWQKSFGGTDDDEASSIQQTTDKGYIMAGYSYSNDGDVTGHHGTANYYDYWVVKIDSVGTNSLSGHSELVEA